MPLLPVELYAHIVSFLDDDRPALRALSLSSRTLHALSHPLLFATRDFRALAYAHLQPFLPHLDLLRLFWRPDMHGDRDAQVLASSLAPHLSPTSIPRLRALALRGISADGTAYLATLAPALTAFPALTSLSLTCTYHRHMRDVQTLLSRHTLPRLAHLHLHAVTWFVPDHNDDCADSDPDALAAGPALTSLRISPVYPSCMRPLLAWLARTPTALSLRALDIPPDSRMGPDALRLFASSMSTLATYTDLESLALSVGMDDVLTRNDARLPDLLAAVAHSPRLRAIELRIPYAAGPAPDNERTHDILARVDRVLFGRDPAGPTALAELRVVLQSLGDGGHGPEVILRTWSGRASLRRADACGRLSHYYALAGFNVHWIQQYHSERVFGAHPSLLHRPYGYYPVRLGQVLEDIKGLYELVRKLGWGNCNSASVWLAKPPLRREQTLLGLKFLNDILRVSHAEHPARAHWGKELKTRFTKKKHPAQAQSPDYVVTVVSQPLPYPSPSPSVDHVDVCRSDFGAACSLDQIDSFTLLQTPDILQPPEQVLGHLRSGSVDVWAVGCMIFEILAGVNPFQDGTGPY
ncbi:hypothetical protein C8Q78DRAFT_990981 [Trametes maxima]|nr:hypothetical protein C8Q78DRAFT_990981 [Trametes maxima]